MISRSRLIELLSELDGDRIVGANAAAVTQKDGVMVFTVMLDDSKLKPGMYVLSVGRIGSEPHGFPLEIR